MTTPAASFTHLVERHRGEILTYLVRLLGHEQDAQDVCQETLLRAFRAFSRLDGNANTRAWLFKIATNRAFSALARRGRGAARASDVDPESLMAPAGAGAEGRERLRAVRRAVDALPAKQRAALMQRRFHGLGYEEIARSLGCSAESARANVYQAMKKLRALLED